MLLVNICNLNCLTYLKRSGIDFLQAHNQTEQSGFTRTVRADDTDNAVWRKREVQVIKQQFVAERLCYVMGLNDLVAQTRTVGDEYLKFLLLGLNVLIHQFVVRVQTGLTLGLTSLRRHTHPLQLTLQGLAAL